MAYTPIFTPLVQAYLRRKEGERQEARNLEQQNYQRNRIAEQDRIAAADRARRIKRQDISDERLADTYNYQRSIRRDPKRVAKSRDLDLSNKQLVHDTRQLEYRQAQKLDKAFDERQAIKMANSRLQNKTLQMQYEKLFDSVQQQQINQQLGISPDQINAMDRITAQAIEGEVPLEVFLNRIKTDPQIAGMFGGRLDGFAAKYKVMKAQKEQAAEMHKANLLYKKSQAYKNFKTAEGKTGDKISGASATGARVTYDKNISSYYKMLSGDIIATPQQKKEMYEYLLGIKSQVEARTGMKMPTPPYYGEEGEETTPQPTAKQPTKKGTSMQDMVNMMKNRRVSKPTTNPNRTTNLSTIYNKQ